MKHSEISSLNLRSGCSFYLILWDNNNSSLNHLSHYFFSFLPSKHVQKTHIKLKQKINISTYIIIIALFFVCFFFFSKMKNLNAIERAQSQKVSASSYLLCKNTKYLLTVSAILQKYCSLLVKPWS